MQLARQANGEVADVDHLLDLAEPLRANLAGLDRYQFAEIGLVFAQQFAEAAHEGTAGRCRRASPLGERLAGGGYGGVDVGRRPRRSE